MSLDEHCAAEDDDGSKAVFVATFPMPAGRTFDWHTHTDHQLAWAAAGVLIVRTSGATWTLPPSRALWIPAGRRHETLSDGSATMRSLYIKPELCPIGWPDFTPVAASPLLAELIGYLADPGLDAARRQHAETMIVDLLQPVPMTAIEVAMPADDRARQVADALVDDPADGRSLEQWGRVVGASERTLARAFVTGTGLPFGRWRTLLRVQSAISALAAGEPVGNVSRRVGYESPSAFVAAFRREIGLTPARYFGGSPADPD
jgi:AraC-like DNA-binding protein/quercetin dioxygenase-like cupin family protein